VAIVRILAPVGFCDGGVEFLGDCVVEGVGGGEEREAEEN
jgi:hypothetical protein